MDVSWPLVGRRKEIELIDQVLGGTRHGLVFAGPPGVGKTRLLRAAMDLAAGRDQVVELVAATRAGACVPLGAVSHLLAPGGDDQEPARLFRYAADRWRGRRVVLAVDDAHLLDDGSAALVHDLCLRGRAVVVGTLRDAEGVPDAITALWKDGLVRRVEVPLLPDSAVAALLDRSVDGRVPESVSTVLCRLAAGNPLHLKALVLDGVDSGALRQVDGVWRWHGAPRGAWRLRELVEARLDDCDAAVRFVVELVACGEPLPLGLVERDAGLDAAEEAGLLCVEQVGRRTVVRLEHPIYGEVLRANMRPIRAREIHRVLAERLAATGLRRRDDVLRFATWQLVAGTRPDAQTALRAAKHAMARYDLALAERLSRAAVDAGAGDASAVLATVLRWRGRHEDGIALVSDGPPAGVSPEARSHWMSTRAGLLYWGLAHHEEATAILDGSECATHAMVLLSEGQCAKALDIGLRIAENESAPLDGRLWAYTVVVCASAMLGRTGVALELADDGERLADLHREGSHVGGPFLRMARGYALLLAGRLDEARAVAGRGYRDAAGAEVVVAAWAVLGAMVAQVQGDLRSAVDLLREAVAIEERQDPHGGLRTHLTILAGALAMTGAGTEARQVLDRADALATPVQRVYRAQTEASRAWVLAAGGEHTRAAELALTAAAAARESGLPCVEAIILYDAARHGAAGRVRGRLADLAETADSALVLTCARSATALDEQDGHGLQEVARTFAELPAPLLAAEALVAASRAYRDARRTSDAVAVLAHARQHTARCPAASTPGLVVQDLAEVLTPREQEIAVLAVGSSSPDIARRLRLSVRTVDNHLSRVYGKLGVSGRIELATLFVGSE
ncbi:LuxR C-terminal-related transcriptional regulator [Lentzea sp. HUAS TT2]|uniref:LuxR C-terminal-related transcriptional regulator n=1 Tax=Lentzea sp. HUAS TT2 TaxID=3447454 RepID=UPI003F72D302